MTTFTQSKDGVRRGNFHVKFRVGYDVLETAAGVYVWEHVYRDPEIRDHDDKAVAVKSRAAAATLTRGKIQGKVRDLLKAHGYDIFPFADDPLYDRCLVAAQPRVRELWPELYSTRVIYKDPGGDRR